MKITAFIRLHPQQTIQQTIQQTRQQTSQQTIHIRIKVIRVIKIITPLYPPKGGRGAVVLVNHAMKFWR